MKQPTLGYFDPTNTLRGVRSLAREEFRRFETACEVVRRFGRFSRLFSIVLFNHDEFAKSERDYTALLTTQQDFGIPSLDNIAFDLNRKILNFLSSAKTFLDHHQTLLTRAYSKETVRSFEKLCRDQYDRHFTYRFSIRLRNYVQHCGMPVGNLLLDAYQDPGSDGGKKVVVRFVFDRDQLLSQFDDWNTVKGDLSALPLHFDIAPLLKDFLYRIGEIHASLMEGLFAQFADTVSVIEKMQNEIKEKDVRIVVFDFVSKDQDRAELTLIDVPWKQAKDAMLDLATFQCLLVQSS